MGLCMPLDIRSFDRCLRRWTRYVGRRSVASVIASLMIIAAAVNSADGDRQGDLSASRPVDKLATLQEMVDALTDVWGDAAMRQTDGASYEFFKDLLPPLRW